MEDSRIFCHIFTTEQGITHLLELYEGKAKLVAAQGIVDGVTLPDLVVFEWSEGDLRAFMKMAEELLALKMGKKT